MADMIGEKYGKCLKIHVMKTTSHSNIKHWKTSSMMVLINCTDRSENFTGGVDAFEGSPRCCHLVDIARHPDFDNFLRGVPRFRQIEIA